MNAEVPKIQDYAVIGNGRSAALVSNRGAIDWLCWPRFDSAAIFAAILDPKIGGHWSIRPAQESKTSRRYIDNTNVLETEFVTASGKIVMTDFMPVTSEEKKRKLLWPEHELVRRIRCEEGEVEVIVDFSPRLDYGRAAPKNKNNEQLGWKIDIGACFFFLRRKIEFVRPADILAAKIALKQGAKFFFSFPSPAEAPAVIPS